MELRRPYERGQNIMQAADIVTQLAAELPKYTDRFINSVGISSIVPAGTTATVTTNSAHGVIDGQNVAIIGTSTPAPIDSSTFIRSGTSATFETTEDHDLTLSDLDIANGGKTITLSGFDDSEFNGTFSLSSVPNRRTVIIMVADTGPTTTSGTAFIDDGGVDTYNGVFSVYNVTTTTFDINLARSQTANAIVGQATAQVSIRIVSVLDIAQYLTDVYTAQTIGADHIAVQLGDVSVSKSRTEQTDATSSTFGNYAHTPILIHPFAVYIVQNVTAQTAAATARDLVESEYVPAILRALERAQFSSGFSYDYGRVTLTGHGVFAFSDNSGKNGAIYVHEIAFEQLARLTKLDMFDPNKTVALRDISYALTVDPGTGIDQMTADVDTDEVQL